MSDDRSIDEVKKEIAHTRAELGETAAALAAKTDVKARVSKAAAVKTAQVKQAVTEKAADVRQAATEKAAEVKQVAAEKVDHASTERALVTARSLPVPLIAAAALAVAGIVVLRRGRR